jgi:L-asparaginase
MTDYPELIGGSQGRLDTEIMTISSGQIVSKVGAEGVQLLAIRPGALFREGAGIAIKIENGDVGRARDIAVVETLRQLRALTTDQVEALLASRRTTRNHRGLIVGEINACFTLKVHR